jgi:hypothetical protein
MGKEPRINVKICWGYSAIEQGSKTNNFQVDVRLIIILNFPFDSFNNSNPTVSNTIFG